MEEIYNLFIRANLEDIESEISGKVNYKDFKKSHENIRIHDDLINLMMLKKCFSSPVYNYNNTKIAEGLDHWGGAIIHNNQLDAFILNLQAFLNELSNDNSLNEFLKENSTTQSEIYNETKLLINFLIDTKKLGLLIYYVGL